MITDSPPRGCNGPQKAAFPSLGEKAGVSALCKVRLTSGPGCSATAPRITCQWLLSSSYLFTSLRRRIAGTERLRHFT
jgi:hypothetical protein